MSRHLIRILVAGALALTGLLGLAGSAWAVDIRSGDVIVIAASEVIDDDLLVTAQRVVIDGAIRGNLFAAGTEVEINGSVDGSVFVGAQELTVDGVVTGSLFAGGTVRLGETAEIGRNVMVGGYSLRAERGSRIGRDVLFGGLAATFEGSVGRDIKAGCESLGVNGSVGGDVDADVGDPSQGPTFIGPIPFAPGLPVSIQPGVQIGPEADIGGKLTYTSVSAEGHEIATQPQGGVVYQTPAPGERAPRAEPPRPEVTLVTSALTWLFDRVRDFATLMLLGALVLWQLPGLVLRVVAAGQSRALAALGWGLLVVILGYILAAIAGGVVLAIGLGLLVLTLGGLSGTVFGVGFSGLGVFLAVFSLLVGYGSKLVVSYWVGDLIVRAFKADNRWLALLVGVVLYVVASGIPFLGWLVALLATLFGVGAMWLVFEDWRRARATAAPLATPVAA